MHVSNRIKTFTYLGGKFSILPFLYENFPKEYDHFIDLCCGSAVVLLNQPQAKIETINDINGKVYNFFKVLQDKPFELLHKLYFTPHSKQEYDNAWYDEECTDIEKARRFFVRTTQSIFAAGAQEKSKGWAAALSQSRCNISEKTNKWLSSVEGLDKVVERLKNVQIENRHWRFVLKHYDSPGSFFYFDGPYLLSTRSVTRYEFEFTMHDYIELAEAVKKMKGKIAISHYDDPQFRELFKDLRFIEGPLRKNSLSEKDLKECLWVNYS